MKIQNQYSWLNTEVILSHPKYKAQFISNIETLIRPLKTNGLIESFHMKYSKYFVGIRIRMAGSEEGVNKSRVVLNRELKGLQQQKILTGFHEVEKAEEDCRVWDDVIIKFLEYNTEIIFLLVRKYGDNFEEELRKKYLRLDFFDMFHLLSNQLGLNKTEDKTEFLRLVYAFHSETRQYLKPLLNLP